MPGITGDGLGIIGEVDNGEAVTSEAVPFGRRRRAPRINDLEIDREITRKSLRVTFGVNKKAAIEATDVKVPTPKRASLDAGEAGDGPPANSRVVTAAFDGDRLLAAALAEKGGFLRGGARWGSR